MKPAPRLLAFVAAFALVSRLLEQNAYAIPVQGSISFAGSGSSTQSGGTSTLTFNPMSVVAGTFEYSRIPTGTVANFAPLSWTGSGTAAVLTNPSVYPSSPAWTVNAGGATFQLFTLSLFSAVMNPTLGTLNLSGTGVAFVTGAINRDPNFMNFTIVGSLDHFTYTLTPVQLFIGPPAAVADAGSTIALFGVSVVCVALLRRSERRTA